MKLEQLLCYIMISIVLSIIIPTKNYYISSMICVLCFIIIVFSITLWNRYKMLSSSEFTMVCIDELPLLIKEGDILFTKEYNVFSTFDLLHINNSIFHTVLVIKKNNQLYIVHSHCADKYNPLYLVHTYHYANATWKVLVEPLLEYILVNETMVYIIFRHPTGKKIKIRDSLLKQEYYYCSYLIGTILYDNHIFTEKEKKGIFPFHPETCIRRLYNIGYKSIKLRCNNII